MDLRFALSHDEQELLAAAAGIAAAHVPSHGLPLTLPDLRPILRALEPLGYLGSVLPVEAGGKGLSPLAFGALVEGLAPDLTLLGNHSVQRYLHDFGSPAQCERFLPGLLRGDDVGAIAITEAQAGSDLARIATTARRDGDGWRLDGRKTWVTHGMVAAVFIVLARSGDDGQRFTRFIVPADTAGLARRALAPVGLTHLSFAELELDGCRVPDDQRLGAEGAGASGAKAAFPLARALAALQALRIADGALAIAADYARERIVAGHALAEQSLVQHGHASLATRVAAARLLAYRVLAELGSTAGQGVDSVGMASGAKALAGELAQEACRWAADCLGSAGLAADHRLVRLRNDAQMMSIVDGTSVLNHLVVARRGIARRGGSER